VDDGLRAAAFAALRRGDWPAARSLAAACLGRAPADADAHFIAGVAATRQNQPQQALEFLRRAAILRPHWPEALAELARACVTLGQTPAAVAFADQALASSPADAATLDMLGVIYGQAGLHAKALAAFEAAVARAPESAASHFNLGTTLAFSGRAEAAEAEYEACLARNPRFWRAYHFLAQARRQTADRNVLDRLLAAEPSADSVEARFYLHMALAKTCEDLGRYADAFAHLLAGKSAGATGRGYTSARDETMFATLARAASDPLPPPPQDVAPPIFVIGMPRSGTTLVERILSSHPQVRSAGELRDFMVALDHGTGGVPGFVFNPAFAEAARGVDWQAVGRDYLASTRHLHGGAGHFVDKLPHNFLFAGFIARALPEARIICLRRDPVDTCLSNFRQVFALDSPYFDYSFDLLDTGRYYLMFERLMAQWQALLPGRILELQYEDLVEDQEAQTRRLLAFCGLPWDDACLRFERNDAPVATASAVQVRAPINRSSIGRWKHYAPQLSGLLELLARQGVAPRES
jgi:Flp pilus assembly protein TadD